MTVTQLLKECPVCSCSPTAVAVWCNRYPPRVALQSDPWASPGRLGTVSRQKRPVQEHRGAFSARLRPQEAPSSATRPAPLHRWRVVERGTSPKAQASSEEPVRVAEPLVLLPSPVTAGKQSCREPFQGNSQCNSLKSSLLAASHRSLRDLLIAPATIQKVTKRSEVMFKKIKLQKKRGKEKNHKASLVRADLQLVNQRSSTAQ